MKFNAVDADISIGNLSFQIHNGNDDGIILLPIYIHQCYSKQ